MTTANHTAQGLLIASYLTHDPYAIVFAGFLSAIWDLFHLQDEKGDWTIYNIAHKHIWWKWLIPFANLHLAEDWLVHRKDGGINKLYVPLEIILWVVMLFLFLFRL